MSEINWGSDHLEAPKKRKIPLWVLGCGGGCMFMVGAVIVAVLVMGPKVSKWVDSLSQPEVQWPRLAEALPFDEQPEGFSIARLPVPLIDLWLLRSDAQDLSVFVLAAPQGKDGGPWGKWMSNPEEAPFLADMKGEVESSEGTLVVQGRELRSVRYTRKNLPARAPQPPDPGEPPNAPPSPDEPDPVEGKFSVRIDNGDVRGGGLALDVTPEGASQRMLIWLWRENEGSTVSDEDAKEFLTPFQIGPRR